MQIQYQFFPNYGLVINRFIGYFSIDDYKEHVMCATKLAEWEQTTRVLNDVRLANFEHLIDQIDNLMLFREEKIKKDINTVILADAPNVTATSQLYVNQLEKRFMIQQCSTIQGAIDLLGVEINAHELNKRINSLAECFQAPINKF